MDYKLSDWEIVRSDMDSLYIGNLNTVEFDLKLPEKGGYGSQITWRSGHPRFLSDEGKVFRPVYGMGNRTVTLTAEFSYGTVKECKEYSVRILEEENRIRVRRVWPVLATAVSGEYVYYPSAAVVETEEGKILSHPVNWESEGTVYTQTGTYFAKGYLTGTEVEVSARILVSDKKEKHIDTQTAVHDMRAAMIRLKPGSPYYAAQEEMKAYLFSVDLDQMLYHFRHAAGLSVKGAPCMEGWDSPECQLRGHTTGHYLSALALCYHSCGEEEARTRAEYMVDAFAECQEAFSGCDDFDDGFLSGYSQEQFDQLERFTPYPEIWAPYYTLHKLFAGLLDCWSYLQSKKALDVACRLGDWVCRRLSRLDRRTRSRMWSMYIAGEFGGMNEVMAKLFQITGKQEYLECAKMFDNDRLFYPLVQETDALGGMHANQHIPQIIGALEIFRSTGEKRYLQIAERFWKYVTEAHTYAPGGTGEGEMFHGRDQIGILLTENTQETCASYNMLKLTKELYQYRPDASYMNYYERTVLNHIAATQERGATGESTYFFPLNPGATREFLRENSCCHGTGMESHFKYRDAICFSDSDTIYINQYIPSVIKEEENGLMIELEGDILHSGKITVSVRGNDKNLVFRKPDWSGEDISIQADGEPVEYTVSENGYICPARSFHGSADIELVFPYHMHLLRTPDRPALAAVQWGPHILAAISDREDFIRLDLTEKNLEARMCRQGEEASFVCEGIRFVPICLIDSQHYHVYVETEDKER